MVYYPHNLIIIDVDLSYRFFSIAKKWYSCIFFMNVEKKCPFNFCFYGTAVLVQAQVQPKIEAKQRQATYSFFKASQYE